MDFNTIIPAIQSGRADVGVSTFSITPERSKSVQFSEPYHSSQIFLLFLKKSSVQGFTDLMNEKVGAQLGSTMEYCAKEKKKTIPMDIVLLNTNPQLVEELKSGRIKAILVEEDQVDAFKKENPDLDAVAVEEKGDPKAIVLSKESDLHAAVNKAIAQLKSSGKIDELQKKWLKTSRTRG